MTIAAIIPAANAQAANAALASFGAGQHFTVSGLSSAGLTHVGLHDWGTRPAYVAAIKALPGVVWDEGAGDPAARLRALFTAASAQWPVDATPLPSSGLTVAGRLYTYTRAPNTPPELWLSISAFNRTTFPLAPETYPSLLRQRFWPGDTPPWKQPIDGFDAFKLLNPISGQPDRCIHLGQRWRVTQADGAGNNVWEPGVFGWTSEGAA